MISAYYNDNDPKVCAWLRELIKARLITDGAVDSRSITEIHPQDLRGFDRCHFFAGIGGWDHALDLALWGDAPVWTGSCPCQPLSCAGQRKGHADERHLWPAFYSLIAECQPPVCFGEQVASKDGREWLAGVRADLEGAGYAIGASDLCAAGVGAPHRRQRLYWVAHTNGGKPSNGGLQRSWEHGLKQKDGSFNALENSEHTQRRQEHGPRQDGLNREDIRRKEAHSIAGTRSAVCAVDNPASTRCDGTEQNPKSNSRDEARVRVSGHAGASGVMGHSTSRGCGIGGDATQTGNGGHVERTSWSRYTTVLCRDGKTRRFEPESFPLAYGLPGRVGLLRGYGNAIVPQLAAEFIAAFLDL